MSQILTNALATYKAQQEAAEQPVILDQIVFAYVPDIDPEAPIDPDSTLPPEEQIVYRYDIPSQNKGFINPDAVVYSCLLGTDIGTWTYNSIYLINSELNLAGSIITIPDQVKVAADPTSGIEGDTLVRNIVTTYANAQELTQITVAAEVWQLDFTLRLAAMDERVRQINLDEYGHASFFEDGWKVTHTAGATSATVQPGVGYVGGLKSVLASMQTLNLTGVTLPKTVYLVSTFQGQANSAWETTSEIRIETSLDEIFIENGYTYYAAPLALLSSSNNAEDLRQMNKETDFVRKSNAATNINIDEESEEEKHINLPQLWRAFRNKISNLLDGDKKDTAASEWALAQVNKKAEQNNTYIKSRAYWSKHQIDLSSKPQNLWYVVWVDGGVNAMSYRSNFFVRGGSGSGGDAYTDSILSGWVQGSGWSSVRAAYDLNWCPYDPDKSCIHSVWTGTQSWSGFVIYLRGGFKYSFNGDASTVELREESSTIHGGTFPSGVENPATGGLNRTLQLTLVGASAGHYLTSDVNCTGQVYQQGVQVDKPYALTRKDYVDGEAPKIKPIVTGADCDTLTGDKWYSVNSNTTNSPSADRVLMRVWQSGTWTFQEADSYYSNTKWTRCFNSGQKNVPWSTVYSEDNPQTYAAGGRVSNYADFRDVAVGVYPYTNTKGSVNFPSEYGGGIHVQRAAGSAFVQGWGLWANNANGLKRLWIITPYDDGTKFNFDAIYSQAYPPTATEVGARPDDWMPTATEVGALQWKKVASGSCSIAWKNGTRETFMETIETGYSSDIVAREHNSGRFKVIILSKGTPTSSDPNNCWWSYRGEAREITYWNSAAGTNQVFIDVYASGANLNAGTGATGWELWELQKL